MVLYNKRVVLQFVKADCSLTVGCFSKPGVPYVYDEWGNVLSTSGTMASTLGQYNPLRYRSYVYDQETGLYYLQSRYYNPEWGRFINADGMIATGQGLIGNNMFAYCGNNPVIYVDPFGTWTIGFSFGANLTVILGVSISIGVFVDDNGNIDVQWSYCVPGVDETVTVGVADVAGGVSFQFTDRDTVHDLRGKGTYIGASGGPWWSVGADVITFSDPSDADAEINGFQVTGGVGFGFDAHVAVTNTKSILHP